MLKTPPQFDPGNGDTTATLISGNTEFTIPALADGVLPKYVMITVDLVTAVHFKVGLAGVDVATNPHGVLSLHGGPVIVNVTGQTTIDFNSGGAGTAIVAPLANQ